MSRPARTLLLLGAATLVAALVYLSPPGEGHLSLGEILGALRRGPGSTDTPTVIVWSLRLPRLALSLLVGALLGSTGSAFQALLRNPLADPFILGVSSGAAVGVAVATLLGLSILFSFGLGFVGGMLTLALVYGLASRRGVVEAQSLILAGAVTGSMLASVQTLVLLGAGQDTNMVFHRLLGDMSLAEPSTAALLFVVLLVGFPVLMVQSRRLNALALGGDAARRLGVDPAALTRIVLLAGGLMTASAVGAVGVVGFLGLVAPHLARRLLGVDWRWSLPGAALTGALLLVLSDLVAQRLLPAFGRTGRELPVGAVTSVLGAPTLLVLLKRRS